LNDCIPAPSIYTETMPLTRPHLLLTAALALATLASPAAAAGDVGGSYEVVFTEVADNCDQEALTLARSPLVIDKRRADQLVVRIPGVPAMTGSERRGGQFRAEVSSRHSPIAETRARYSVAGRVREGQIQLVFIAEFYRGERPLCTQSFSGAGAAADLDASGQKADPRGAGRLLGLAERITSSFLLVTPR
jgi:hypothetical protein